MELRKGYKQTEVGVIPEDWVLRPIGSFSTIYGRIGFRGYTKKDIVSEGQGAIALNPSNIQGNKLVLDGCTYVTWEKYHESPEIKIQEGDVILVKTGSTTGKTCYVDRLPIEATLNPQMIVFKKMSVNQRLIGYVFASPVFQNQLTATVVGGALPTLSQKQVAGYKIPLPSTEVEQRAIATALSDVDALLDGLDRLIAKKRDLKQAAMQQLLTGKTRLPGFEGEWEETSIGKLATLRNGYAFKSSTYTNNGMFRVITIANVQDGRMDLTECNTVTDLPNDLQPHHQLRIGDLLISMTGNVGRVCRVTHSLCLLNQRVGLLYPIAVSSEFLFHLLSQRSFLISMVGKAKGGAQGNLSKSDISDYTLLVPTDPKEQTAIATVLSDMDAEIAALEQRRNKTKDIKQAMMQELLTGKTRLVTPGGSNA